MVSEDLAIRHHGSRGKKKGTPCRLRGQGNMLRSCPGSARTEPTVKYQWSRPRQDIFGSKVAATSTLVCVVVELGVGTAAAVASEARAKTKKLAGSLDSSVERSTEGVAAKCIAAAPGVASEQVLQNKMLLLLLLMLRALVGRARSPPPIISIIGGPGRPTSVCPQAPWGHKKHVLCVFLWQERNSIISKFARLCSVGCAQNLRYFPGYYDKYP